MKKIRKFIPIFFIVFIWFIFSSSYFLQGKIPFPSKYLVTFFPPWSSTYAMPVKNNAMPDVISQIYPWKRLTINSFRLSQIPLWNPYSFSGTSHTGNYQSAVFSPINILFFIFPEIDAWSLMILFQPLLAGLFMYLFIRSLKLSKMSSLVGAIAFMFCGFIVVWMAYGTLAYAVLYLPLALYAVNKRFHPLLSLAIALSFISGHLQMSLYVLAFTITYIVFRKQYRSFIYVVLGIFLAAPQILPAFQTYTQSARSSGVSRGEIIPWQYLVTFFAPDFYGNAVTRNDWFGHYAEWAGYVGVVPLLLSIVALFNSKQKSYVRFFWSVALVSILLATPSFLNNLMYTLKIPVLSNSSAARIIVLTSFSLCIMASFGIDSLHFMWQEKKRGVLMLIGSAGFVAIMWGWLLFFRPFSSEHVNIAIHNLFLPTIFYAITLAVLCSGYFISKKYHRYLFIVLILVTGIDVLRFAIKWMPYDPREYVYPKVAVLDQLRHLTAENHERVFGNIGGESGTPFSLQLIEGYDAVYQKRYGEFISSVKDGVPKPLDRSVVLFDKHGKYAEDVLRLLGVRYMLHKKSDGRQPWAYPVWDYPNYNKIWEDENFEIFENTKSLPRAFLASSYVNLTNDQKILDAVLTQPERLVLEAQPSIEPQEGLGEVKIIRYTPNEVIIQTNSEVPKLLFLSDVYDAGWNVTVDSKPDIVLRAAYVFRAVALPKGEHIVRMYYWPKSVILGLWLSFFGTLGIVGTILWKRKN